MAISDFFGKGLAEAGEKMKQGMAGLTAAKNPQTAMEEAERRMNQGNPHYVSPQPKAVPGGVQVGAPIETAPIKE